MQTQQERKYKFQKMDFKPKALGIDIRGGYCSKVRKSSQAYKKGVRSGWRIVNIDGDKVPREDREIASLIRSCIDSGSNFPVIFRLPPVDTYAGYKCGDVVEALDSTGRQWNKCLIIDIVKDKFSIVYIHNAVRSKKFQAMLRRLKSSSNDDDDDEKNGHVDPFDEDFDDELDGKLEPKKNKKKGGGSARKSTSGGFESVEVDASTKKLLKQAIGKEASSNAREMVKEYARVAAACADKDKRKQVVSYLEGKLVDRKHPSRVLKSLLLSSYLLAYGDDRTAKKIVSDLSDDLETAANLDSNPKTQAGKAALNDIKSVAGPAVMQLLKNPQVLQKARKQANSQTQAKLTLAPPPGETGAEGQTSPTFSDNNPAFQSLTNLTSGSENPYASSSANNNAAGGGGGGGGLDLGALFDDEPAAAPQNQQQSPQIDFISAGFSNMSTGNGGMQQQQQQPQMQQHYQQQMPMMMAGQVPNLQAPQNLWGTGLVDLGLGPAQPQKAQEKKVTMRQLQGEELDLGF